MCRIFTQAVFWQISFCSFQIFFLRNQFLARDLRMIVEWSNCKVFKTFCSLHSIFLQDASCPTNPPPPPWFFSMQLSISHLPVNLIFMSYLRTFFERNFHFLYFWNLTSFFFHIFAIFFFPFFTIFLSLSATFRVEFPTQKGKGGVSTIAQEAAQKCSQSYVLYPSMAYNLFSKHPLSICFFCAQVSFSWSSKNVLFKFAFLWFWISGISLCSYLFNLPPLLRSCTGTQNQFVKSNPWMWLLKTSHFFSSQEVFENALMPRLARVRVTAMPLGGLQTMPPIICETIKIFAANLVTKMFCLEQSYLNLKSVSWVKIFQ